MSGAPWTEAEDQIIIQARAEGLELRDTARRLPWRTQYAVRFRTNQLVRMGLIPMRKRGEYRAYRLTHGDRSKGVETKRRQTLAATGIATWDEYQLYRRKGFSRQELIERHRGGV